jgi:hypothetical protein
MKNIIQGDWRYVLHNMPSYIVDNVEIKSAPIIPVTKIIRSLYDMQKSAAHWDIYDYGVTKSPDAKT